MTPWEWKEYSKTERERAIKNASIAFDFLKISKTDQVRLNLSPSGKRSSDGPGKRKSSEEVFEVKKVKSENGPVKIDRVKLKMNVIKPASTLKPDGPDKVVVGSPESEGKQSSTSDQSLKRKGDDTVMAVEKKAKLEEEGEDAKGKFEGVKSKSDRSKLIQTPKKVAGNGKVSDPKPQPQSNKRPGSSKRRGNSISHFRT